MLNEFGIINMNGRLYDPVLGRFFSPDNYVQLPDFSQSYNRYSYCLNNPLKYTDPSGELFGIDDEIIAFALFNMASSMMQAAYNDKNVWKAGGLSLLSSAATYGIGSVFGSVRNFGHEVLRAGAHGLSSGVFSVLDDGNFSHAFLSGAAASIISSHSQSVSNDPGFMIVSSAVIGGSVAWLTGGDFLQGAFQGMQIAILNHCAHDGDDENKIKSQQQLKEEIEKDGILTFKEARRWYREGDGSPITVDADKIDLDFVNVSSMKKNDSKSVETWFGGIGQGIVYGGITIVYKGNNQVGIQPDQYNFEMHSWDSFGEDVRNIETLIARPIHGNGKSFKIFFKGINTIHHRPHIPILNRGEWSPYTWSRNR